MKKIDPASKIPEIPAEVAVCPICQAKIVIDIDEWETKNGRVTKAGFHITCETQPEPDDRNSDNWWNWHYQMPYVDWLPVQAEVYKWFDSNFRYVPL